MAIYREHIADGSAVDRPGLAMALNNLSGRLAELDQREDALATTSEAVTVYRELFADEPGVIENNVDRFPKALNDLSSTAQSADGCRRSQLARTSA